jgi:hypothetical protein
MPLHPNLRKGSMSPKEKAAQLAEQFSGQFKPTSKPEPYYAVPLNINNRDITITTVEVIIRSKELTKEDRDWWKEVLVELKKLP